MSAVSGTDGLAPQSPLSRRLLAWASERFPLANAALFVPLYLVALLSGRALTSTGCPGTIDWAKLQRNSPCAVSTSAVPSAAAASFNLPERKLAEPMKSATNWFLGRR